MTEQSVGGGGEEPAKIRDLDPHSSPRHRGRKDSAEPLFALWASEDRPASRLKTKTKDDVFCAVVCVTSAFLFLHSAFPGTYYSDSGDGL